MSGADVLTFGCRLNLAEGESVRSLAPEGAVVVNSCAVTGEAARQAVKAVRKVHRERPDAPIIVTGCAAELEPERFAGLPGVVRVLGNAEKLQAASYLSAPTPFVSSAVVTGSGPAPGVSTSLDSNGRVEVGGIWAGKTPSPASTFADRSRGFVQVQAGCDHRCTFCIIPFARGNGRSVPPEGVIEKVASLVDAGAREVVLTGVDLTGYGADLPGAPKLGDLVARILARVPALPRLRLSSIDAVEIDPLLEELLAGEARLMPHLHLSLQSGDDMILKRMRRRHSRAQAIALVQRLKARRPELAIGADLIAGFPTETEAMAANSLQLIEECDIVLAHIFPFSPRAGTPAARMPQVEPEVARERARLLRAAAAARRAAWLAGMVGSEQRVLVERGGAGHAENFAKVILPSAPQRHSRGGGDDEVGAIRTVSIAAVEGNALIGEAA